MALTPASGGPNVGGRAGEPAPHLVEQQEALVVTLTAARGVFTRLSLLVETNR